MSPALPPTPGQTVGPFFGYALPYSRDSELVPPGHPRAVRLYGRVTGGAGQPVPDALLELWQLGEGGSVVQQEGSLRRDGWTFTGWGRASTDDTGSYTFTTLKPGAEPGKAAFFAIAVFARGPPNRLFTRAYLPQDAALAALADRAEAGGNPVIGVVQLLRERLNSEPGRWVHRGLTSQDVLDTALMICLRDVVDRLDDESRRQVEGLCGLVSEHRSTPMVGRTLTQHAVPITFGLKAASWLTALLDAAEALAGVRSRLAVQLGGAAGTLAASTELARLRGLTEPARVSWRLVESVASALGLAPAVPWHTSRSVITAAGDAMVGCIDAYGRIATDVATLSRPEIAELAEGSGGGSSTMPQKNNPMLSVLIRRAALTGPPLASTLHLSAATNVDERPDGSWHAEWATLRDLARRTVVAASQASELITRLVVDEDRMAANLGSAAGIEAEQQAMADLVATERSKEYLGTAEPSKEYLGATELIIDRVLARARQGPGAVR